MYPNSDSHQHLLRSLDWSPINLQQVRSFQRFETEVMVLKISRVYDGPVEFLFVGLYDVVRFLRHHGAVFVDLWVHVRVEIGNCFTELLFRLLMMLSEGIITKYNPAESEIILLIGILKCKLFFTSNSQSYYTNQT